MVDKSKKVIMNQPIYSKQQTTAQSNTWNSYPTGFYKFQTLYRICYFRKVDQSIRVRCLIGYSNVVTPRLHKTF